MVIALSNVDSSNKDTNSNKRSWQKLNNLIQFQQPTTPVSPVEEVPKYTYAQRIAKIEKETKEYLKALGYQPLDVLALTLNPQQTELSNMILPYPHPHPDEKMIKER